MRTIYNLKDKNTSFLNRNVIDNKQCIFIEKK